MQSAMPRFKQCLDLSDVPSLQSALQHDALSPLNSVSPHYLIVGLSSNTVMLSVTAAALKV